MHSFVTSGGQGDNVSRSRLWRRVGAVLFVVVAILVVRNQVKVYLKRQASAREVEARQLLFAELRPVALANCRMERFGEPNDGGYLVCANLLGAVKAGYSYGISGYDQWGCDVSLRLSVPIHQYDCFNTAVPQCPGGRTNFHAECVGGATRTEDGRSFDTIANQLAKNGDGANHVVLKIDVEGAEWESFATIPDEVLQRIDQLMVEFHGFEGETSLKVVQRLKQFFHVAHFHENNFSCQDWMPPFPSWAYEVLFVNKRLDQVDPARTAPIPHPLDAPNHPTLPDCATQNALKSGKG
jgi:hypothetical protein